MRTVCQAGAGAEAEAVLLFADVPIYSGTGRLVAGGPLHPRYVQDVNGV